MKFRKFSLVFAFILVLVEQVFGQSCQTSYSNYAIYGNDLTQVAGASSSCCQACQQNSGCLAYTWTNANGGTCWLKSATAPLYAANGQFTVIMSPTAERTYSLNTSFDSTNFFDLFDFKTYNYGNGFTNFTDKATAMAAGIAKIIGNKIYIGTDNVTTLSWNNTKGRDTVRLESVNTFDSGLIIFSVDHIPTGPALWPAFWTYGPNWPDEGEIDILESITELQNNQISLHTNAGCSMNVNDSIFFNGQWGQQKSGPMTDCQTSPGLGCSIEAPNGTFNEQFNQAGGGVYAMEWDNQRYIRIWNFVKPNVPADITNNSPNPNPDTWGMPTAYFAFGPNCNGTHFRNHVITINNAMCGWAGQDYIYPGGECKCENNVRFAPYDYSEAYFLINYVKVFCRPGDPCLAK